MPDANLNVGIKVNTQLNSLKEFSDAIKVQKNTIIELTNTYGALSPQVKKAEQALADLKNASKEINTHLNSIGNTSKMSGLQLLEMGENLTTLVAGITVAISKVVDFAKEIGVMALKGAEVAEMRKYFDEMNGGVSNATEKFEALIKASNGKLNNEEILRFSNRMDDLGYSTDETTKLMDMAERKGDELGITINESALKFTQFIETGRGRGLYKIGVDLGAVNEKMVEQSGLTQKQIKELDTSAQIQIRKNAVLTLYGKTLDEINSKEKTTEATLMSIGVAFSNAKIKVGEFLSGGIAKLAEIFGLTSEKMATVITITGLVIGSIMAITAAVIGLTIAFGALDIATGGILIAIGLLVTAGAVIAGLKMSNDMENSVKSIKEEIGKTTGEITQLKTELKDLNTLQELTTGTVIDGEAGYEKYKTTLEELSKKYPGLTNGITINKQALDDETNAVRENIARKEELIRLDLEKEISSQIKAFVDESDQLEKNKKELDEWKEKLIDTQKANDRFKPTFELAGIQEAKDKIAELSRSIALTEQPVGKLKRNFMDFIAEGIKTGNVSFAMDKLGVYTKNNTVLQGALKDAVKGLSSSFIAEYLGINKALEKSAELQAMWVNATILQKMGFLETAAAMYKKVSDYAKLIDTTDKISPPSGKTKTVKEDTEKEIDLNKTFIDLIFAQIDAKKRLHELTIQFLEEEKKKIQEKNDIAVKEYEVANSNYLANPNDPTAQKNFQEAVKHLKEWGDAIDNIDKDMKDLWKSKLYDKDKIFASDIKLDDTRTAPDRKLKEYAGGTPTNYWKMVNEEGLNFANSMGSAFSSIQSAFHLQNSKIFSAVIDNVNQILGVVNVIKGILDAIQTAKSFMSYLGAALSFIPGGGAAAKGISAVGGISGGGMLHNIPNFNTSSLNNVQRMPNITVVVNSEVETSKAIKFFDDNFNKYQNYRHGNNF